MIDHERVKTMFLAGAKYREIGAEFGVTRQRAEQVVRELGLTRVLRNYKRAGESKAKRLQRRREYARTYMRARYYRLKGRPPARATGI